MVTTAKSSPPAPEDPKKPQPMKPEPPRGLVVRSEDAAPAPPAIIRDPYEGASLTAFPEAVQKILAEPVDPKDIDLKPHNGVVFLPGTHYRRKLNKAFGAGGWAMIPRAPLQMNGSKMYQPYALYVGGRFMAEAIGSQEYIANNKDMDYADAAEGVKTNAIQRCCKDLGIACELWDKGYIEKWKTEYAEQFTTEKGDRHWRRKDRAPAKSEKPAVSRVEESKGKILEKFADVPAKPVKASSFLTTGDEIGLPGKCRKCASQRFTYLVWTEGPRKGDGLFICAGKCDPQSAEDKPVFFKWYDEANQLWNIEERTREESK